LDKDKQTSPPDRQTKTIGKAIDDADRDYLDFTKGIQAAINEIT
jgi:hypothetical protein